MILSIIVFIIEVKIKKVKGTDAKENGNDEESNEWQNDETETPKEEDCNGKIGKTKVDVEVLADIQASLKMPASNVEEAALP